jgi:hypothetical protein
MYELDSVVTYNNSLFVILGYAQPGHQGATITQLFVAAEVH